MKVNRDIQSTPSIYDKDYVTVFSRTMMICEMKYLKKKTSQFESLKYSVGVLLGHGLELFWK